MRRAISFSHLMQGCIILAATFPALGAAFEGDSFRNATRTPDRPDAKQTMTGKSIADLKAEVEKLWPTIEFSKNGQPVNYVVDLETDLGTISVEFYPDVAPNHSRSFICLSKVGFFDGLIFHRCIPNFVIQGGCPLGTGTGGPGYALKPEFNNKPHVKGELSMARSAAPDSAGSQFFICTGEPRFLDGKYTVFGHVTKGMDVVDQIVSAPTTPGDRPVNPVHIKKATVRTK